MAAPPLSIVMPVLNEAEGISAALQALAPLVARGVQVVVADGGSTDGTQALVQQYLRDITNSSMVGNLAGTQAADAAQPVQAIQIIKAPRGRAVQMNAGARHASAALLLFLHADTALPADADRLIEQALAESRGKQFWGRFDVHIAGRPWLLRVIGQMMNVRSRWTGIATGDQAIFMSRAAFDAVGGFPVQALMEDIEMSSRLLRLSRPACLHARVVTAGRRWESRGVWRTMLLMWRLRFAYWRGVAPDRLAQQYR